MNETKKLEQIENALIMATIKAFEEMAFIEVIHFKNKDYDELNSDFTVKTSIDIIEPLKCRILFEIPEKLLKIIVENIYSKSFNELLVNDINDCVEEILNVLAGNFLIEFFGVKHAYKIELPEMIVKENDLDKQRMEIFFNAEGNVFKLIYTSME